MTAVCLRGGGVMTDEIPNGYCHCGCGRKTTIAPQTRHCRGHVKGMPMPYLKGHNKLNGANSVYHAIMSDIASTYVIDQKTGCWLWRFGKVTGGYGRIKIAGKTTLAHRYIYERLIGK